jgi:hypothetical protein
MTKEQVVINLKARAYLTSTDWYVTRLLEKGIPIPQEISDKRDNARQSIVD